MKFTIDKETLKKELEFVQGIVEKKSTIPVLSNLLIESVGDDKIRIVGTDLDITIRCEAQATVEKKGVICVQARKLFDIVRLLGEKILILNRTRTNGLICNAENRSFASPVSRPIVSRKFPASKPRLCSFPRN